MFEKLLNKFMGYSTFVLVSKQIRKYNDLIESHVLAYYIPVKILKNVSQ